MKNNRGFTLIELLVVIAIFALIANVTMVSLNNAKMESRDAERMSDINQLRSALILYSTEKITFPDGSGIALGIDNNFVLDTNGWSATASDPVYMYQVPRDPSLITSPSSDACVSTSSATCDYGYTLNGDDFIIYFYLEGGVGSMSAGLHAATRDLII